MSLLLLLSQTGNQPVDLHTHIFTLLNTGDGDLHIGTISLEAMDGTTAFSIVSDAASGRTVAPNASVTVRARFEPTVAGPHVALLHVPSDDPDGTLTITVTGNGVVATTPGMTVDPLSLAFGSIDTATGTVVKPVNVESDGTEPLTVGTITLTGAGFTKTTDNASGQVMQPGTSHAVYVTFDPASDGAKTGTLTIPATGVTTVVVPLSGTGTTAAPPVPPVLVERFYLGRLASPIGDAPEEAGFVGWDYRPDPSTYLLATAKSGPAVSWGDPVPHAGGNGETTRLARWVSDPLAAQVLSSSFLCYAIGYRQSSLGTNVTSALRFGIWRAATETVAWQPVRAAASAGASAWATSTAPLPRRFPRGDPWSWSVTIGIAEGDRLIVELGARAFTTAVGTVRMRWGGASGIADLASTQDAQDLALAPWLEFATGLLVLP